MIDSFPIHTTVLRGEPLLYRALPAAGVVGALGHLSRHRRVDHSHGDRDVHERVVGPDARRVVGRQVLGGDVHDPLLPDRVVPHRYAVCHAVAREAGKPGTSVVLACGLLAARQAR